MTMPTSISLLENPFPSLRLRASAAIGEQFSSSITSGATEMTQLTSAHSVKKPSDKKITHIE